MATSRATTGASGRLALPLVVFLLLGAAAAPGASRRPDAFGAFRKFPPGIRAQLLQRQRPPRASAKRTAAAPRPSSVTSPSRFTAGTASSWSAEYGSGIAPAHDAATDLAMTPGGAIAVTGYSTGASTGADIVTMLYDPSGARIWTARFDGADHGDDVGVGVAADDSGNIYVTGKTARHGQGWDIAVIKYGAGGALCWSYFLDVDSADDEPVGIAVDDSGDVYVAATVAAARTLQPYGSYDDDILLLKLSRNAVPLWSRQYDGAAGKTDRVAAMALDPAGNIILAGSTFGADATDDILLKYSPGGTLLAQSTPFDDAGGEDELTAIAVDAQGFVYVTGWSTGNGTAEDQITLKYSSDLTEQWGVRYDGPAHASDGGAAIAVTDSGKVLVAGWSVGAGGSFDIITTMYAANGAPVWTERYDGPAADLDIPADIALDGSSNIYVAGSSTGTATADDILVLKYDASGTLQAEKRYDGLGNAGDYASRLVADPAGNVYVAGLSDGGSTGFDAVLLKFSLTGAADWADRYDGPGNSFDRPVAVATDAGGNIYVAGQSDGILSASDVLVLKYDPAGTLLWNTRLEGASGAYDNVTAMAIDSEGSVYVTGASDGDYLTLKLSGDGQQTWSARYDGPAHSLDEAAALVIDPSGGVLVTGRSYGADGSYDIATVKYGAASGNALWVARYAGPAAADDEASDLRADAAGNVYVTGSTGSFPDNDYLTLRYDGAGNERWAATYNGTGNSDDRAMRLALLPSGRLVVTGQSFGLTSSYDIVTLAYDTANGSPVWSQTYNGPGNAVDEVRALAVDRAGDIVLTGATGSGPSSDMLVLKLSAAGSLLWSATAGRSDDDAGTAVVTDGFGNIYAAGYSYGSAGWSDILWVKYSPDGASAGPSYDDSPNAASDAAVGALIDNVGNLVVTAQSYGIGSSWITTTALAQPLAASQTVTAAWNMLSLPLTVANPLKTALYPAAISDAFVYGPTGYAPSDTITPRAGYWMKFGGPQTISLAGEQRLDDTLALHPGWNLIGSIAYPLPVANIVQAPNGIVVSPFYAYAPGSGYIAVDTISPFAAYWVKANSAGSLILDLRNPLQEPGATPARDGLNEIAVIPSGTTGDRGARLFFGEGSAPVFDLERFVLPPAPPPGAFDARFASGGSVALLGGENTALPLRIQGAVGATIRWNIVKPDERFWLVGRDGGRIVARHVMSGSGQAALRCDANRRYTVESLPQSYGVAQNWPNPFNPSTTIGYDLPAAGPVRLAIFNALGQQVFVLVDAVEEAGHKTVVWNAEAFPSGVYFCRLTAAGLTDQKKMLLIK